MFHFYVQINVLVCKTLFSSLCNQILDIPLKLSVDTCFIPLIQPDGLIVKLVVTWWVRIS